MDVSHESPSSMDEYFPDELRSKYDIASAPLHQNGSVNVSLVDIDWSPDAEKYKKRRDKHALNDSQLTTIPHGWPHEMVGPLAWTGRQFDEAKYVIQLSDKHISELESALDTVAGKSTLFQVELIVSSVVQYLMTISQEKVLMKWRSMIFSYQPSSSFLKT